MMALETAADEMTLACLLEGLADINAADNRRPVGVKNNSREIESGDLFLACKGERSNGAEYIDEAIAGGACAVAVDADLGYKSPNRPVPVIAVARLSENAGLIAHRFYQAPSDALNVIGVTGTNGKTSVTFYIARALAAISENTAGIIGTLGIGTPERMQAGLNTTPDPLTIHRTLAGMRDQGLRNVVMEVSSHALVQARVAGVSFDIAVFTNLSREHLDYHGDMEAYAEAKRQLFTIESLSSAVINIDDEFGRRLCKPLRGRLRVIGYGIGEPLDRGTADEHVYGILNDTNLGALSLNIFSPWGEGTLNTGLTGAFNAGNLLASLTALCLSGVEFDDAMKQLANIEAVPGRMECFTEQGCASVIVDYAHTPDALQNVLTSLDLPGRGKLVCVLGCGGDRDQGKRPQMGRIAELYADQVILTNDNPRNEKPETIIQQILEGMERRDAVDVIPDRLAAISTAIHSAARNDIVLIAGKGHETWQETGGVRLPFSDRQVVRNLLEQME